MSSDRKKSPKTKRHELGFQLTIEWCVTLVVCFLAFAVNQSSGGAIAFQSQSTRGNNNVQVINAESKELAEMINRLASDLKSGRFKLDDGEVEETTTESTTSYQEATTAAESTTSYLESTTETVYTTTEYVSTQESFTATEGTTTEYPTEAMMDQVAQESYRIETNYDHFNSLDKTNNFTLPSKASHFKYNPKEITSTEAFNITTTEKIETNYDHVNSFDKTNNFTSPSKASHVKYNPKEITSTEAFNITTTENIEINYDHVNSFDKTNNFTLPSKASNFKYNPNEETSIEAFIITTTEKIEINNDHAESLDKPKNITTPSKASNFKYNPKENTSTETFNITTTEKIYTTEDPSINAIEISTRFETKKSSSTSVKPINKKRKKNKNRTRTGQKGIKPKNAEVNHASGLNRKIDLNDDDFIKINSTNCKNCTEGYKNTTTKNTTDVDFEEMFTQKNFTDEDYNMSYEIGDFEEDLKMIKMKKNATEEPLTFGPFDALRDIATSAFQSIYERVIPQGLRDIVTRLQEQNARLETYNLRSKEENGGIGQFGRSLLKGISGPLNQLMQGVRDYGSLDSDRNFFSGVASGVVSLADSVSDSFKDRVKAIYPGTLWCGDGNMGKSAEVGVFFMTDSCCRRHDACKYYILAGETKYGLTNTGIFTRSHCECDKAFFRCLKKTNSLVSSQIGVTYFSILGPQCFKRDYPIVKCSKRTRVTGQKCEEYLLDETQPKVWQWFDSETF